MENFPRKFTIGLLFLIIFTPYFLILEIPIHSNSNFSPVPLEPGILIENSIVIPESLSTQDLIQQKLSLSFQSLLKTADLEHRITCIILLNDQPTEVIASQIKSAQLYHDRAVLRKTIYYETQKQILPAQNALSSSIASLGGKVLEKYVVINALLVDIPLSALPTLVQLNQIARIEPNYQLQAQLSVSQKVVTNTTAPGWDYSYNGSGVVVAVCDTGIDKTHPALVGRVLDEKNFYISEVDADDYDGHGTHVAGIIASNDTTYLGVASEVSLINVKIMGSGGVGDTSNLINGTEWLLTNATQPADVINLSAGTTAIVANGDSSISKFIDAIVSSYDIVWVIAAGNSGSGAATIEVPGDAINCISVANFNDAGSTNPGSWGIAGSSSRGPTIDGRKKPDIAAPGTNIHSCQNGGGFVDKTGTSMATPHVAGAAALTIQYLKANHASLQASHALLTKAIFLHTAYDLGTAGYDYAYGFGAIDLGAVWNFLQAGNFTVDSLVPSFAICKYSLNVTSPQILNLTVVWDRIATTDYEYIYFNYLADINLRLESASGQPLDSSTSSVDNVEYLSYNASAGLYYLYVEVVDFKNVGEQKYAICSDTTLTFVEKIHTWTLFEIILTVCIIGIVAVSAIFIILWLRDRKATSPEEPTETFSTLPDWPTEPAF